ncbi:MAG TPA: response regulator transcription factor [Clostridia bacterium]|nr:response regulator transcription factor [Clostridia bacterium]
MKRALIIEDEIAISDLLAYSLRREGIYIDAAYDGTTGLKKAKEGKFHLIMLDLMLPDMSGLDICKELSDTTGIPVIILTAKSDIVDKVIGFELGAFDYITKPFDVREVVARVKALLKRKVQEVERKELNSHVQISHSLSIYTDERKVLKNGYPVELTPKEYDLLVFLLENRGTVFTREKLLDAVWGYDYMGDSRTVDIHVVRLRKKLGDPDSPSIIDTVFGVGYKMVK